MLNYIKNYYKPISHMPLMLINYKLIIFITLMLMSSSSILMGLSDRYQEFYKTWMPKKTPPPTTIWWRQIRAAKKHASNARRNVAARYKALFISPHIKRLTDVSGDIFYKPSGFFTKREIVFDGSIDDDLDTRCRGMIAQGAGHKPHLLSEMATPAYLTPKWVNQLYKALSLKYGMDEFEQPAIPPNNKIFRS